MVKEGRFDEMRRFLEEVDPNQLLIEKQRATATHIGDVVRCLAAESKDPERVRGFVEFLLEKKLVNDTLSECTVQVHFPPFQQAGPNRGGSKAVLPGGDFYRQI